MTHLALERHYTIAELAELWSFAQDTIRPWFLNEPGVLKVQHSETRNKRGYTSLRIPESVALRVHARHAAGQGAALGSTTAMRTAMRRKAA
jgi:hypothetical protein